MEFDMNQLPPASNPEPKNDSSENQTSENPSGNNAVQTGETENVDSNTLAAVLQFLQKHNLKVSYATFETVNFAVTKINTSIFLSGDGWNTEKRSAT